MGEQASERAGQERHPDSPLTPLLGDRPDGDGNPERSRDGPTNALGTDGTESLFGF
jgi:hypothetical protein